MAEHGVSTTEAQLSKVMDEMTKHGLSWRGPEDCAQGGEGQEEVDREHMPTRDHAHAM